MKTNSSLLHGSALAALTAYLLMAASPTTEAQTYNGQLKLADAPTQLETNVYPLLGRSTVIKVAFSYPKKGSVHIIIRNEKGKVFYDAFEWITNYNRNFDLSDLPTGNYAVEFSTKNERVVRPLAINTPAPVTSYIAMGQPAIQTIPDLPKPKGNVLSVNK